VRPFVRHHFVLEAVFGGEFRYESLEGGGQELFDEPELHRVVCVPHYADHHDVQHALIEVA
jgi:hypothetical protein